MSDAIAKDLECVQFEADDETAVQKHVSRNSENLVSISLSRPEQVYLTEDDYVTLSGNYEMSWNALTQTCRYIANGSCSLILDLAGRRSDRPKSLRSAVTVYNELVKTRFRACLVGKYFLVDRSRKLVVAIVPAEYRAVQSSQILGIFESVRPRVSTFVGGIASGTRVVLDYSTLTEESEELPDWLNPVTLGFLVDIDESGQSGFKLLRTVSLGKSVRTIRSEDARAIARQAQRRKENRIRAYLSLLDQVPGPQAVLKAVEAYTRPEMAELLGFGLKPQDNEQVSDRWVRHLRHKGITESTARQVLRRTLQSGGQESALPEQLDFGSRGLWPSRTVRDLYVAIAADASERPFNLSHRIAADRIVYSLLFEGGFDPYGDQDAPNYGRRKHGSQ